jgi:hypothetical protein
LIVDIGFSYNVESVVDTANYHMSIAIPLLPHIRGRSRRFTTYLAHPLNSTPTFNTVMTRDVSRHPAIRIQDDYKPPQRVSRPTLSRNPHHLLLISHACSLQQARGTPLTHLTLQSQARPHPSSSYPGISQHPSFPQRSSTPNYDLKI